MVVLRGPDPHQWRCGDQYGGSGGGATWADNPAGPLHQQQSEHTRNPGCWTISTTGEWWRLGLVVLVTTTTLLLVVAVVPVVLVER